MGEKVGQGRGPVMGEYVSSRHLESLVFAYGRRGILGATLTMANSLRDASPHRRTCQKPNSIDGEIDKHPLIR